MNILILLPYIPYPLDSGGNSAVFHMIDHYRGEHRITVVFDVRGHGFFPHLQADKLKAVAQLRRLWPDVEFCLYEGDEEVRWFSPRNLYCKTLRFLRDSFGRKYKRAYSRLAQKSGKDEKLLRAESLLSDKLVQYESGFLDFVAQVSRRGFDVIQVEMYEYLYLGYVLPKEVKKVFIHHELRFVRNWNELSLFKEHDYNDLLAYEQSKATEIAALNVYDKVVTLSDYDRNILAEYLPKEKIISSPVAVHGGGEGMDFKACKDFVFIGSGGHYPNRDALGWFCEEVLPVLRTKAKEPVKLYVVGKWDKPQMKELQCKANEVEFTGYIPDLASFINGKISIVPLRIGSGIRVKILESVFACSPLVTTAKGMEGISLAVGDDCLVGDTASDFADCMLRLSADEDLQRRLACNAQKKISVYYNFERLFSIRKQIYL